MHGHELHRHAVQLPLLRRHHELVLLQGGSLAVVEHDGRQLLRGRAQKRRTPSTTAPTT